MIVKCFHTFVTMVNEMSPYLLLGFFIAGLLHAFVPSRIYARYLAGTGARSVLWAAALGVPLPLCSCGVLPTAVSLRRSGASRAASTSFLIATPQTGVDSIAATWSMMGLPFAILRPVAALVTAVCGGMAVGTLERRGLLDDGSKAVIPSTSPDALKPTLWGRLLEALRYGFFEMMQSIGKWLVIGLIVATLIVVWLPDDFFATYARYPLLNMLVIVAVAVPMYVCATGSIPIAAALILKGLSPGCALVLLMAGPAASAASILVVNSAFGRKATAVYLASIVLGAIGFGCLVDYWPWLQATVLNALPHHVMNHTMSVTWWNTVCSIALLTMIVVAWVAKYRTSYLLNKNKTEQMKSYKITGMMCQHCRASVEKGLAALNGVDNVTVDLATGMARIEGDVTDQQVDEAVTALGYQCQRVEE